MPGPLLSVDPRIANRFPITRSISEVSAVYPPQEFDLVKFEEKKEETARTIHI